MSKLSQSDKIIALLQAHPNQKFNARQIAEHIIQSYPDRPRVFCSYYDQSKLRDQGVDSIITLARRRPVEQLPCLPPTDNVLMFQYHFGHVHVFFCGYRETNYGYIWVQPLGSWLIVWGDSLGGRGG